KLDNNKPNFLAVHFCQLHWPYTSNSFIEHNPSEWNGNYNHFMYKSMLKKIDKQIELFYQQLELNGFLRNSIVYIISDHEEGFKLNEKDDFNALKNRPPMQSWGHGTNVLDQQQAKVLLAKIRYKNNEIVSEPAVIEGLFSLIDILPSIDQELKLNLPIAYDGFPLPAKTEAPNDRHLFVESSLSLSSLNASFIDEEKVVSETASIYEIRPSGKAVIKPEEYRTLIRRKQRSIYQGEHQLAMLPDSQLVLLNIEKKEVKIVGSAENNHIVDSLLLKLCQFYKTDYGFDEINRCDYDNNKYPDNG
ncbi:sulfatase-like hydrolase/transferase, partial [Shewanella sp. GutDb-MelDb]|uniref:sulfatase-like hydrolase/transferase n=1 Tax=Shewanella sp. GutDb-MelDb TaxID=2058316 RepID=UPI000CB9B245